MFKDKITKWEHKYSVLLREDKRAWTKESLVGRFIQEPIGDGYAYYKIVKDNKRTVHIEVVKGLGDDWIIPYWGEKATINRLHAVLNIAMRDRVELLFGGCNNGKEVVRG